MIRILMICCLICTTKLVSASFLTVDFSSFHNSRMHEYQSSGAPQFPEGNVTLGDVLFNIPTQGNNVWNSFSHGGANPRQIDISVGITGVDSVHSIINTYWGENNPGNFAAIEFYGSNGAFFRRELDGGVDIRDFNDNIFTNTITSADTQEVFSSDDGQTRLDMQTIDLPDIFLTNSLDNVRLIDNGSDGEQRIFIAGLTLDVIPDGDEPPPVPVPGAIWMFAFGLLSLLGIKKKSRQQF